MLRSRFRDTRRIAAELTAALMALATPSETSLSCAVLPKAYRCMPTCSWSFPRQSLTITCILDPEISVNGPELVWHGSMPYLLSWRSSVSHDITGLFERNAQICRCATCQQAL